MNEREDGAGESARRHGQPTRGFLFTDLRGYTAFLEQNGASAAADVLAGYRALVRDAIEQYRGAEIRTEGDSFYVVFPSVSAAVECGVAIAEAVERNVTGGTKDAVGVGVGVHAGETIETAEGYVGSAVNLAARLCALAGPGEVLVSDTVRALTRNVLTVAFVARGRRRLKGIAEPVAVYAVRTAGRPLPTDRATRLASVPVLAAALVLAVAVGGTLGFALLTNRAQTGALSSTAPASATAAATAAASRSSPAAKSKPSVAQLSSREQALLEHVPPLYRSSCVSGPGVVGKAQLVCTIEGVGRVTYIHFDNREAMQIEYDRLYKDFGREAPGIPTCREGPYERPYAGATGTQTGRVVCYEQTAQPNVVWTDDELAIISDLATDSGTLEGLYRRWNEGLAGPIP